MAPLSLDGSRPLEEFEHLKLRPRSGKALVDEYVSIVQHPSGGRTGSPVFSDEWEVVALP